MKGDNMCVYFQFHVGDTQIYKKDQQKMKVSSKLSNKYCFFDESKVDLVLTNYSKIIAPNKVFSEPIQAKVLKLIFDKKINILF
jgi:hypothetical protein